MIHALMRAVEWIFGPLPARTTSSPINEPNHYRLNMPQSLIYELREATRPTDRRPEPLAFLRVRFASEDSRMVAIGIRVMPFPEDAYVGGPAGANFSTEWAFDVANAGIPDNLGLMLVHAHGGEGMPMFSNVDMRTNRSIMATLAIGAESAPFGAVVLSDTDAHCVLAVPDGLTSMRVIVVPDRFGELKVSAWTG